MPYLNPELKHKLDEHQRHPESQGELNYRITSELIRYINLNGLRYATINDILGALEGAKLEFYRRVAIPYENTKIVENGDVY